MDAEHISAFGSWAAAIGSSSAILAYILERGERKSAQHELAQQRIERVESEVRRVIVRDNRANFDSLALADKSKYRASATNKSGDSIFNLHFIFETDQRTLIYTRGSEELSIGDTFRMDSNADCGGLLRTRAIFEDIKGISWWRCSTGTVSDTAPPSLESIYRRREFNLGIRYGTGIRNETSGLYTDNLNVNEESS